MTTSPFVRRHIGPAETEVARMLDALGVGDLDSLVKATVPDAIRDEDLTLPAPVDETEVIAELRTLAARNRVLTQMIGLGYNDVIVPPVIQRNILENPAWYTAYTPYQPEISQGRLEALLNFQTLVSDLTALPVSGASLLDESTAAAEAMQLCRRAVKGDGAGSSRAGQMSNGTFLVDAETLPQTVAVLQVRAEPLGIAVEVADLSAGLPAGQDFFGVLLQHPGASGVVRDLRPLIDDAHTRGAQVVVAADLLALTLLTPPGELGADIAVGTSQRLGLPMAFGGPHAGYLSVRSGLERSLPGRLVGVSVDADGAPAYRLALQTREQHIRREKATSNICTAQVLLAVLSSTYAVYHGPDGLAAIAQRIHRHASTLAAGLTTGGITVRHSTFFDTVTAVVPGRADAVVAAALRLGINLRRIDADSVAIACDEATTAAHIDAVWQAFGVAGVGASAADRVDDSLPTAVRRTSPYLTHPVFNTHRSETSLLRYLRRLADRDLALDRSMIPLGSCTMKLNATAEMASVTWPEFAGLHPFAPLDQAEGTVALIHDLERWLAEITGYAAVSLQPNAGSQGELAGLLAIRAWHRDRGEAHRTVCLIPSSAHGTNAASAVMAGMRVVVVACDDDGNVDLADLRAKADEHAADLSALMVTYPSTHGVYEEGIRDICAVVHEHGGQVYVDGANLNALVGLAKPGAFGADVSHLNLHKTFCIPHGGGGPGVGPVAVRSHLAPYLPGHPVVPSCGPDGSGPVSGAPWGSAGILQIPWAYIRLMGAAGLRRATEVAVLSANYVARALAPHYPVLYTGRNDFVAHECILDLREITKTTGVTVDDVAKRLIDYGFHAPTMSFPVAGTLMVEPTESEDLAELDRFIAAMVAIKGEIDRVAAGEWPADDSPLRGAPHTAASVSADVWDHPYSREVAAYPLPSLRKDKYWPPVRRIDGAHGDRNLMCSCPPVEDLVG